MPKVTIDGEVHDVELDAVQFLDDETPEGFTPTSKLNEIVKREKAKAQKSTRTTLASDDDFKASILAEYGVELREDGTVKGASKDAAALEAQWKAKHLTPVEQKLAEATEASERYRRRTLDASILEAARDAGVKPALLKALPGGEPAILGMARTAFAYDADSDSFGIKNGDAFQYATGGALAGPTDYFATLKADSAFADVFASTGMSGAGHSSKTPSGAGRVYTQSEINSLASDPETWAKNRDDVRAALTDGRVKG